MYLKPSDDRTAERFSSADSFLVWWKSSHSSPSQSRSPSPNQKISPPPLSPHPPHPRPLCFGSGNNPAARSRSLSPILPSAERHACLSSKPTSTSLYGRLKCNNSNNNNNNNINNINNIGNNINIDNSIGNSNNFNNDSKARNKKKEKPSLSSSFTNFLRQRLGSKTTAGVTAEEGVGRGERGDRTEKEEEEEEEKRLRKRGLETNRGLVSKPARSLSLENLPLIPIEVHQPSPTPSARRLFQLDRQASHRQQRQQGGPRPSDDPTFLDSSPSPLTLFRLEDGRFSALAVLERAPRSARKIVVEIRGFVVEVEFSLRSAKKGGRKQAAGSSFKSRSPESGVFRLGVDGRHHHHHHHQDAKVKDGDRPEVVAGSCRSSFSAASEATRFKLSLPIFADASSLSFDWLPATKSLLVSGAVKGCAQTPGSAAGVSSAAGRLRSGDFLATLSCCGVSESNEPDEGWVG